MQLRSISLAIAILLLTTGQANALAQSPKRAIQQSHNRINSLLNKKQKSGSKAEKNLKVRIKKEVNSFLDYAELAKRSLGRHWAACTDAERTEFVDILQQLIERNYTKQLRSNLGYKISYESEKIEGDDAQVKTVIVVKKNRRKTEITIDYKLRKAKNRWMVYDVITDDVSIVRNYRSQFNRIIRRDSYEVLVKKMRSKLDEKPEKS